MKKIKYEVVNGIARKGYPTASKDYHRAHELANEKEKKKYPKQYSAMKKIDAHLAKGTLAGTHTKSGKIKVSSKVPKKDRADVAYHEYVEHKADPGHCKKCGKGKKTH